MYVYMHETFSLAHFILIPRLGALYNYALGVGGGGGGGHHRLSLTLATHTPLCCAHPIVFDFG